jgi:hypothetical protein
MNNAIQFEDRVSSSRSKHEGESSAEVCDRLSRTRVSSQRQLPTDHDYAVPTREYQLDQSSPIPATAAAESVLEKTNTKTTQRFADVDRVTPYQLLKCARAIVQPEKLEDNWCWITDDLIVSASAIPPIRRNIKHPGHITQP